MAEFQGRPAGALGKVKSTCIAAGSGEALELIGECARRIPEGTRLAHPSIPWKAMIGARNIIAHEYGRVDPDQIWKTAQRDVPLLVSALEEIVATLPPLR